MFLVVNSKKYNHTNFNGLISHIRPLVNGEMLCGKKKGFPLEIERCCKALIKIGTSWQ